MVVLSNVVAPPTDGLRFTQPQTSAVLENTELGDGTLYIAESCISWRSVDGRGFSLAYPSVTLHAVSRDLSTYPRQCLYLMVSANASDVSRRRRKEATGKRQRPVLLFDDLAVGMDYCSLGAAVSSESEPASAAQEIAGSSVNHQNGSSGANDDDNDEEEDEDDEKLCEIRFVPTDVSVLEQMFTHMSECQTLHPDEEDADDSDDPDAPFYYDGEDETLGENEPQVCLPTGAMGDNGTGAGGQQWFTSAEHADQLNEQGMAVLARIMAAGGGGGDNGVHDGDHTADGDESMETDHHDAAP